jgi:hypothetical protein
MNKLILALMVLGHTAYAGKLSKADWEVKSGKLVYHVSFPLKKVQGVSEAVRGKGHCDKGTCQFLIAVPVKSFLSGDGNRDNHMLEVTRAADNTMVVVKVKVSENIPASGLIATAEINFAGKSHNYDKLAIATDIQEKLVVTKGTIPMKLSDFSVDRPSLLGVSIEDAVPVDFDLTWN